MEACIVRYFSINKECPLPGIGSLISNEQPAVLDIIEKKIIAPRSFVRFSVKQINEASLLKFIQSEYKCDIHAAKEKLGTFLVNISSMDAGNRFSIGALGNIIKDASGQYSMEDGSSITIYSEDIFAERLIKLNAPHAILVGDKETTREAMQEYYEEDEPIWKSKWWIASIIIFTISAALILLHYFYFNGNNRFGNHLGF